MPSADLPRAASRGLVPTLVLALLAMPGCAATRERVAALELPDAPAFQPSRPAWLALPEAPDWRGLARLARWLGPEPGEIRGTVRGTSEASDSPGVLVYLDPVEPGGDLEAHGAPPVVRRSPRRFEPSFLVVLAGESVVFSNQDRIYHRIFSYSEPNAFELGVLAQGESEVVTFAASGEVRFYCALHPGESGVVFVTPSPWFARAERSGAYRIADVPPGEYRLKTWSESGLAAARAVTVHPGGVADVDLSLR